MAMLWLVGLASPSGELLPPPPCLGQASSQVPVHVKSGPCSLYHQLFYVDAHPSICDQLIKNNEPR